MKTGKLILSAAALIALCAPLTFAQNIHHRKVNQQTRIAQGVNSGQLTPGETAHLERQQRSINHEERNMRKADNGHLTTADRHALNRRQNRASRDIYAKKHNDRVSR
ncbi:MAG: hypothetical protein KGL02_14400 [Acidobacteriota bacterium]|nr:hypothetical protein [Acidobacteriota bacterium]MDE3168753.1 hypothetical protein [Acidobacteriota bacterium]